ncbi:MAG: sugar phosphate isomerase/epimerase [Candidatus Omnitrophica bacterium]|nr:sugar phosphate isomerase/epimerase [Candidatus Omnitrophota bacterium]
MKLSFVVSISQTEFEAVAQGPWKSNIDYLASLGYEAVELAIREAANIDKRELSDYLSFKELKVSALGTGQIYLKENLSLSSKEDEIREKAVKRIHEHIDLAKELQTSVIIGLIRGGIFDYSQRQRYESLFLDSLSEICAYAASKGVNILLEPINRYETALLPTLESAAKTIYKLKYNCLGILMDTFHMNIEEKDISESILKFASLIKHVHFSDSNRLAPGQGHIDFCKVLDVLKKIGYEKYISFEILPKPDFKSAAKDSLSYIRKILEKERI